MIELRAVPGKTGRLLGEILAEKGVNLTTGDVQAVVSYGIQLRTTVPSLNANAGRMNKYLEMQRLRERGVLVPDFASQPYEISSSAHGSDWHNETQRSSPRILGRRFKHTKGIDIQVYWHNPSAWSRSDYFVRYITPAREYRVWAFRNQCLGVYEKFLRYPAKQRRDPHGIPWNWRRGYAFEFYHNAPEELKALGVAAVKALDLDFGAVDILHGQDGRMYVLEVNTAPGVRERRQGLTYLATKIARWTENGFKERK